MNKSAFDIPDDFVLTPDPLTTKKPANLMNNVPSKKESTASRGIRVPTVKHQRRELEGDPAPRLERTWKTPEYRYPTAMREAIEKARACQPTLITMSGNIEEPEA